MSRLYVDTSALLKRVLVEPESNAVAASLAQRHDSGDLLFASSLAWVEAARALRRAGVDQLDRHLADATAGIAELPVTPTVVFQARSVGSRLLRSLDALHLAAAVSLAATHLMTYDERLAAGASALGVTVLTPS